MGHTIRERRDDRNAEIELDRRYAVDVVETGLGRIGAFDRVLVPRRHVATVERHHATRMAIPEPKPAPRERARRVVVELNRTDLSDPRHRRPDGRWTVDATLVDVWDWTVGMGEAVRILRWPLKSVRTCAIGGLIPAIVVGARWRFNRASLEAIRFDGRDFVPWVLTHDKRRVRLRTESGAVCEFTASRVTPIDVPERLVAGARAR